MYIYIYIWSGQYTIYTLYIYTHYIYTIYIYNQAVSIRTDQPFIVHPQRSQAPVCPETSRPREPLEELEHQHLEEARARAAGVHNQKPMEGMIFHILRWTYLWKNGSFIRFYSDLMGF